MTKETGSDRLVTALRNGSAVPELQKRLSLRAMNEMPLSRSYNANTYVRFAEGFRALKAY
jgi:hypothetical protein